MDTTMIGAYAGMVIVLAAFSAETRGIISSRSLTYLILMAIGEALLTVRAYVTGEWLEPTVPTKDTRTKTETVYGVPYWKKD